MKPSCASVASIRRSAPGSSSTTRTPPRLIGPHAGTLERGEQRCWLERLAQHVVHREPGDELRVGDHRDDDRPASSRMCGSARSAASRSRPLMSGSSEIERHRVERALAAARDRLGAGAPPSRPRSPPPRASSTTSAVIARRRPRRRAPCARRCARRRRARQHRRRSPSRVRGSDRVEHAALARRRAHADGAALRLDEPARQREPEAGALMALRRAAVELLELDEQPAEIRRAAMPTPVSSTSSRKQRVALGRDARS